MKAADGSTTVQDHEGEVQQQAGYDNVDLSGMNFNEPEDDEHAADDTTAGDAGDGGDAGDDPVESGTDSSDDDGENGEDRDGADGADGDQGGTDKITIGGKEYDVEAVTKALDDSANLTEFQKSATEKAMEASNLRKAVEPVAELIEALQGDNDLLSDVKDALVEALGEDKAELIDNALKFDRKKWQNPFKSDVDAKDARIGELEGMLEGLEVLAEEKSVLRKKHQLSETRLDEVVQYAANHHKEKGVALSLEEAYKLMDYDNQAQRKKATPPKPPKDGGGAKDIKNNSPAASYEDIKLEGMFED